MTLYGLLENTSCVFELQQINRLWEDNSDTYKTSTSSLKDFILILMLEYSTHIYCVSKMGRALLSILADQNQTGF